MRITRPKSFCVPMSAGARILPHFHSSAVLLQPSVGPQRHAWSVCQRVCRCDTLPSQYHTLVRLTKGIQGSWHCLTPDNRTFVGIRLWTCPGTTSTYARQPPVELSNMLTCTITEGDLLKKPLQSASKALLNSECWEECVWGSIVTSLTSLPAHTHRPHPHWQNNVLVSLLYGWSLCFCLSDWECGGLSEFLRGQRSQRSRALCWR